MMKERDKFRKGVRELLKHVSRLCTGKNRTEHIYLACAEGSTLQCYSLESVYEYASEHCLETASWSLGRGV